MAVRKLSDKQRKYLFAAGILGSKDGKIYVKDRKKLEEFHNKLTRKSNGSSTSTWSKGTGKPPSQKTGKRRPGLPASRKKGNNLLWKGAKQAGKAALIAGAMVAGGHIAGNTVALRASTSAGAAGAIAAGSLAGLVGYKVIKGILYDKKGKRVTDPKTLRKYAELKRRRKSASK